MQFIKAAISWNLKHYFQDSQMRYHPTIEQVPNFLSCQYLKQYNAKIMEITTEQGTL